MQNHSSCGRVLIIDNYEFDESYANNLLFINSNQKNLYMEHNSEVKDLKNVLTWAIKKKILKLLKI